MSAELLAGIAGIVLSLGFEYIPGLAGWYDALAKQAKQLVMLAALVVTAGAIFGLACLQWFDVAVACTKDGALGLVGVFVAALIANQGTYNIARRK